LPSRLILITRDFERRSWFCAPMWNRDWHALATSPALAKVVYRYQTDVGLLIYDNPTGDAQQ
jgi:hypothetical protein